MLEILFRTIYGPELEAVFLCLKQFGSMDTSELFNYFGTKTDDKKTSSANLEDALLFLKTAGLVGCRDKKWHALRSSTNIDRDTFKLRLLQKLRKRSKKNRNHGNTLDPYFMGILEILFNGPDMSYIENLHEKINELDLPLPCSEEKVNAWRRVMEYLEVGIRGYGGMLVVYRENLVLKIIQEWPEQEGPLQQFLEKHFQFYLPWKTKKGDIAFSLAHPLKQLEENGCISLFARQDLPCKGYLESRKIKWLKKGEGI